MRTDWGDRAPRPVRTPLFQYLDTVGDGTGTKQAIGDYRTGEVFRIDAPPGFICVIYRMLVHIQDAVSWRADRYGGLGAALPNGISIWVRSDDPTREVELTDGIPIKSNAEWAQVCYNTEQTAFGAGDDYLRARWTFSNSGQPLILRGDSNDRLTVELSDDFTGLVAHTFKIQGISIGAVDDVGMAQMQLT